ncbi:unnamed protein product [Heligmosomoides polygyrus]|uniref:39S ribosomal protein L22, mitochondrial n=1 Tax=Heligmosomoides polygyrus TaxID=6339 RepID=A0A183GEU0_HELPZ|nr:unnamed protein product [Heligmosomoides polygyrus]
MSSSTIRPRRPYFIWNTIATAPFKASVCSSRISSRLTDYRRDAAEGPHPADSILRPTKEESIKRMAMSKKELDKIQQLHYGWYVQAVSALLGAIGKEHYMKMDRNNRRAFVACLDNIDKEHDLQSGAKCLVKAFDKQLVKSFPYALHRPYYDFVGVDLKHRGSQKKNKLMRKAIKDFAMTKAARLLKLNFTKKSELLSKKTSISPKRRLVLWPAQGWRFYP